MVNYVKLNYFDCDDVISDVTVTLTFPLYMLSIDVADGNSTVDQFTMILNT